jgi:hypothetical protein
MKSIKISLFIIAAISLGIGIFVNANEKKAQTAPQGKIQGQDTNCLECATPSSRAALMKKSIANFEEEKPSKE